VRTCSEFVGLLLTALQAVLSRIEKAKVSEFPFDGSCRSMLKDTGWRGGFILSALESYIKLDLTKHFKVCPRTIGRLLWSLLVLGHSGS
jgi:hypothetical protein